MRSPEEMTKKDDEVGSEGRTNGDEAEVGNAGTRGGKLGVVHAGMDFAGRR